MSRQGARPSLVALDHIRYLVEIKQLLLHFQIAAVSFHGPEHEPQGVMNFIVPDPDANLSCLLAPPTEAPKHNNLAAKI